MSQEDKGYPEEAFRKRSPWSHKGDFGRLLVIGGSRRYTGAPALVAMAALRAGCDLVTVAAPERAANVTACFSPDLITEPLNCDHFRPSQTKRVQELSEEYDALVVGNGLGTHTDTRSFIRGFLEITDKPCVIDADALGGLGHGHKTPSRGFLLTPHGKEFALISGSKPSRNMKERKRQVKETADSIGCAILLKGRHDVMSDGNRVAVNSTGNAFMTKGGTGDVLAGICGAFLAMGFEPFEAAAKGSYANGIAGEMTSRKDGPGLLASDMIRRIPQALRKPELAKR